MRRGLRVRNAVPLPAGVGGAERGLLGLLVLYGVSPSAATAATLAYGAIGLVIPALLGVVALPFIERLLTTTPPSSGATTEALARHP